MADAVAELGDAVRVAGDAALAGVPVAGRQVVQHQLQAVGVEPLPDLGGVEGIREQELDGLEAGLGGALEAVEERHLGEQHRQVGGETRHVGLRSVVGRSLIRAGRPAPGP